MPRSCAWRCCSGPTQGSCWPAHWRTARRKALAAPLTGLAALRAALSPPGACCAVSGPRSALVLYVRCAASALRLDVEVLLSVGVRAAFYDVRALRPSLLRVAQLEGVVHPVLNFASSSLAVEYDPARVSLGSVLKRIKELGYDVLERLKNDLGHIADVDAPPVAERNLLFIIMTPKKDIDHILEKAAAESAAAPETEANPVK